MTCKVAITMTASITLRDNRTNTVLWENPSVVFRQEYEATSGRSALDPAERKKIYEQIAAIVLKDRPIVYLFHRHWLWAHTAKLSGLRTIPDGLVRVQGLKMN